jgi:putative oxidoreductase
MKRSEIPDLIGLILIILFVYAAVSKLIVFTSSRVEMMRQPVPRWSVDLLVYMIPTLELLISGLLLFRNFRTVGLIGAFLLLLIFTSYVALAMSGVFGMIPCSCGGIIGKLSWPHHFFFNLIFLSISLYGIVLDQKERRFIGR